jgi:hypothetical protein
VTRDEVRALGERFRHGTTGSSPHFSTVVIAGAVVAVRFANHEAAGWRMLGLLVGFLALLPAFFLSARRRPIYTAGPLLASTAGWECGCLVAGFTLVGGCTLISAVLTEGLALQLLWLAFGVFFLFCAGLVARQWFVSGHALSVDERGYFDGRVCGDVIIWTDINQLAIVRVRERTYLGLTLNNNATCLGKLRRWPLGSGGEILLEVSNVRCTMTDVLLAISVWQPRLLAHLKS